jgi:IclR family transcriptional regulator, KDG regulon repressor
MGVTELSRELGVAKSTTHRLLSTLFSQGYVQKSRQLDTYALGLKLVEMGQHVVHNLDIRTVAAEPLHQLMRQTGETTHLVMLDNDEVVYVDKIESPATIRMYSKIGKRAPLHCTGVGKALLAFLAVSERDEIIGRIPFKPYTQYTITNTDRFVRHLEEIRQQGYAVDDEEHEEGIRCVAAPVFDHEGGVAGGISVSGPTLRVTEDKLDDFAHKVLACAKEISRRLGYV